MKAHIFSGVLLSRSLEGINHRVYEILKTKGYGHSLPFHIDKREDSYENLQAIKVGDHALTATMQAKANQSEIFNSNAEISQNMRISYGNIEIN